MRVLRSRTDAQREALFSTAPECAYMGRRLGGKSWIGCRKALEYAVRYGHGWDGGDVAAKVAICREERASMTATTVQTLRDEILGPELFTQFYRAKDDALLLPNRSIMRIFGLDKPGRALGGRYGLMFVDQAEQLSHEQYQIAVSCCMQVGMPWSQFLTSYNPENPEHWAFLRYRPDLGSGERFDEHGKFADVTLVGEHDLMDLLSPVEQLRLERLEGVHKLRLRYGRWVAFTGICFENWDPASHIIDAPALWEPWGWTPPPTWRRYRAIDFGYNPDPYCHLWAAESPEGAIYVYRQDYRLRLTLDEQIERVRAIDRAEREALVAAADEQKDEEQRAIMLDEVADVREFGLRHEGYADHQADARAMYAKGGIRTKPARKEVQAGIEAVLNRLSPTQPGGPRLFFVKPHPDSRTPLGLVERDRQLEADKRPTCFEEEVGRYVWKVAKTAAGASSVKDVPVDENNHGADALRYLILSRDVRRRFL